MPVDLWTISGAIQVFTCILSNRHVTKLGSVLVCGASPPTPLPALPPSIPQPYTQRCAPVVCLAKPFVVTVTKGYSAMHGGGACRDEQTADPVCSAMLDAYITFFHQ